MRGIPLLSPGDGESRLPSFFSDRRSRIKWELRASIILLHVTFVGALFVLDRFTMDKLKDDPWHNFSNFFHFISIFSLANFTLIFFRYTGVYLVFFAATLFQYLFTSCSSPGYVIDAVRATNEAHATSVEQRQSASVNKTLDSTKGHNSLARQNLQTNTSAWLKLVMVLYPPGQSTRNWTCIYCNVIQPPRSKHCNECHRCVLKFDHHCAWLGTCIGRGNHCRFWWYVLEEVILCIWTATLYIAFLRSDIQAWWKDFIVIVLLALLIFCFVFLLLLLLFHSYLLLTNQTTYEIIRRRRILYLREIPENVHLFSRGIYRNLCAFCCSRNGIYTLEAVPSMEDIEARAQPYTFSDVITCRCC